MTDAVSAPVGAPRPRRRGLFFPLLLIALGALFFAGNLGYVPPVSARALVQLWPLVLVIVGIELILARREPYLALAIQVLVIVGAIALLASQPGGLFLPVAQASSSASVARAGATSLSLRVDGGAGTYTVAGGASALVEARSEGGEIRVREDRRGDASTVRVDPAGFGGGIGVFGGGPPVSVDVRVASDLPVTSLRVAGGAGDFFVDMRDIQVRDARIETGASKLEVTLPKPSGDVRVRIRAGAATLSIVVPDDVEASVTTTGGLISTNVTNARFSPGGGPSVLRTGATRASAGYDGAKDRVTVTIEAGASSITIR